MKQFLKSSLIGLSVFAAFSNLAIADELDNAAPVPATKALVIREDKNGKREVFSANATPKNEKEAAQIASASTVAANKISAKIGDELDNVAPTASCWHSWSHYNSCNYGYRNYGCGYNYNYSYYNYSSGYNYWYAPTYYTPYSYGGYNYYYYSYSYANYGYYY